MDSNLAWPPTFDTLPWAVQKAIEHLPRRQKECVAYQWQLHEEDMKKNGGTSYIIDLTMNIEWQSGNMHKNLCACLAASSKPFLLQP
eukprot:13660433-Alexandrium_andersonii.AAC.2